MNPVTLMFQTGYLTIKSYDNTTELYTLGYPKREVKLSVLTWLVFAYIGNELGKVRSTVNKLGNAFICNDIPKLIKIIDILFSA